MSALCHRWTLLSLLTRPAPAARRRDPLVGSIGWTSLAPSSLARRESVGETAPGADAWSRRRRARRAPGRHRSIRGRPPWSALSSLRMKSTSPHSHSRATTGRQPAHPHPLSRDPVRLLRGTMSSSKPVFSGGVLGMRRTFILHASGSKLPSDLLGLYVHTYGEGDGGGDGSRRPEASEGDRERGPRRHASRVCGGISLTALGPWEPSAVSLIRISRDRDGALELHGRCWQEDGKLSARYWSEAVKERRTVRAFSITGRAIAPCIRTHRNWKGREKSAWSRPTARRVLHDGDGRPTSANARTAGVLLARRPTDWSHPGRTRRSSDVRTSSQSGSGVGNRSRTPSCS